MKGNRFKLTGEIGQHKKKIKETGKLSTGKDGSGILQYLHHKMMFAYGLDITYPALGREYGLDKDSRYV